MVMLRAHERKQLQEGLNTIFGLSYKEWPEQWREIFTVESSDKAFEEDVLQAGLAGASVKPEGSGVEYDEMYEVYTARYTHETIAKAVAITEEAVEDNLYASVGARISKQLAIAMRYTREVKSADVLNYGFDSNFAGGDGQPLFSTAHPLGGGGTLSNTLATPADVSESSLEEAIIQIGDWTDERGIPKRASGIKLIIPTALQFVAYRILNAEGQPDTNDNNPNALRKLGILQNGFSINRYLTDPDAWFIKTDVPDGLKAFTRVALKRGLEGDFETGNLRYKVRERYSQGWSDPRGMFGSPGA